MEGIPSSGNTTVTQEVAPYSVEDLLPQILSFLPLEDLAAAKKAHSSFLEAAAKINTLGSRRELEDLDTFIKTLRKCIQEEESKAISQSSSFITWGRDLLSIADSHTPFRIKRAEILKNLFSLPPEEFGNLVERFKPDFVVTTKPMDITRDWGFKPIQQLSRLYRIWKERTQKNALLGEVHFYRSLIGDINRVEINSGTHEILFRNLLPLTIFFAKGKLGIAKIFFNTLENQANKDLFAYNLSVSLSSLGDKVAGAMVAEEIENPSLKESSRTSRIWMPPS